MQNLDAQGSSSAVLFVEFRTFGGMLTNVHLFFVVFFSYLSFFFPSHFWRLSCFFATLGQTFGY